jgi:hypothetical protein
MPGRPHAGGASTVAPPATTRPAGQPHDDDNDRLDLPRLVETSRPAAGPAAVPALAADYPDLHELVVARNRAGEAVAALPDPQARIVAADEVERQVAAVNAKHPDWMLANKNLAAIRAAARRQMDRERGPDPTPAAPSRQPWEMTREEVERSDPATYQKIMDRFPAYGMGFDESFAMYLREGLERGKDVPLAVRKKYLAEDPTPLKRTGRVAVEPHERTRAEVVASARARAAAVARGSARTGLPPFDPAPAEQQHRAVVRAALKYGKVVPAEVLADYPDLTPPAGPASPAARAG